MFLKLVIFILMKKSFKKLKFICTMVFRIVPRTINVTFYYIVFDKEYISQYNNNRTKNGNKIK